mmetsp:Transcript_44662/g.59250  ORF Transcript_44662/g.59250 Transcript_44662/m.59250 type:complete len:162 (-) Transcript_44662:1716-2201(-)
MHHLQAVPAVGELMVECRLHVPFVLRATNVQSLHGWVCDRRFVHRRLLDRLIVLARLNDASFRVLQAYASSRRLLLRVRPYRSDLVRAAAQANEVVIDRIDIRFLIGVVDLANAFLGVKSLRTRLLRLELVARAALLDYVPCRLRQAWPFGEHLPSRVQIR